MILKHAYRVWSPSNRKKTPLELPARLSVEPWTRTVENIITVIIIYEGR